MGASSSAGAGWSSLSWKLMALSLAALTPGFIVIGVTQWQVSQSRRSEVRDLALRGATQASAEVVRIVSGVQSLLLAVSRDPAVRGLREADCSAYLSALQPELPHLVGIRVVDAQGNFRCGSTQAPANANFADRDYFKAAMGTASVTVGGYTVGRYSKQGVLPVVMSMRDAGGPPLGVIIAAVDLRWLSAQLLERGLPPGGSVTVADRNGVIVARQPLPEQFVGTRIPDSFMRLVNASSPGTEEVLSQDGTRRMLGYVPAEVPSVGLYVSTGLSTEASYGAVVRAAWLGALLAALVGLTTLAATWFAGQRLFVRPLRDLTASLARWRGGERSHRTGLSDDRGEIGGLGAELDRMMDEIQHSQEDRELLSGELAHRIKNMLAMVHAIASSTLNKDEPARELLPDFLARMTALSRTQDVLTSDSREGAEAGALVHAVVRPLVTGAGDRVLTEGPPVQLPAREALGLTMVLHELCTNAIKYGALSVPGGRARVTWDVAMGPAGPVLDLVWREEGGPPVQAPAGKAGFGTRLMARALGQKGRADVTYLPSGVVCTVSLSIAGKPAESVL
jgi:two-component sensor histidine kinase